MLLKRGLLIALLLLPISAWAFAKPIRLLLPQQNGVTCLDSVCVEDAERMSEATALYDSAHLYVRSTLTPLRGRPLIVFCSTANCYRSFGGGEERAITFPKLGSIIAPNSWAPHFVRHELIHALQSQELGAVKMMLVPAWFREGMAYSISDPPNYDMPPQFLNFRSEYDSWSVGLTNSEIWSSGSKL